MPRKVIPRSPKILSVQSHVVSGYCGNKSATFPLQLLEFDVDVINSVQLSNHTQYKVAKGQIFNSKDLETIHTGLKENELLALYDCILTGYVADVSYVESMAKLIGDVKQERRASSSSSKRCIYTLDPVLGDDGPGFYVPGGVNIAIAYKKHLLPLADIITPNRFEASILSGVEIDLKSRYALDQAVEAIEALHKQTGVGMVVLTSLEIEAAKGELICLVSQVEGKLQENGPSKDNSAGFSSIWTINVPKLDYPFTGTGDLFTALLTGWLYKLNFDVKTSLENTVNTIHDILEDTFFWSQQIGENSVQSHELRLVQNRSKIIQPSDKFKAKLYVKDIAATGGLSNPSHQQDNIQAKSREMNKSCNVNNGPMTDKVN